MKFTVVAFGLAVAAIRHTGITWIGMFQAADCCLLARNELHERFSGWTVLQSGFAIFPRRAEP